MSENRLQWKGGCKLFQSEDDTVMMLMHQTESGGFFAALLTLVSFFWWLWWHCGECGACFLCSCSGYSGLTRWIGGGDTFGDTLVFLVIEPLQLLVGTQLDHQRHQSTHFFFAPLDNDLAHFNPACYSAYWFRVHSSMFVDGLWRYPNISKVVLGCVC